MKKMFIFSLMLLALCSCGEKGKVNTSSEQIKQTEATTLDELKTTETESNTEETSEPLLIITEPITSIPVTTQSTPTITIESCTRDHDDNYGAVLTVIYKFTNTTDREHSFSDLFIDTVKQEPFILPCLYFDNEAKLQRIQPNESITIKHIYNIVNEYITNPFEIEITNLEYGRNQTTYLYKSFDYKVNPDVDN